MRKKLKKTQTRKSAAVLMADRILTPKFTKDVAELRVFDKDIRKLLEEHSIRDLLEREDADSKEDTRG